jgi:PAS domain-containing protein
MGTGAPVPRAIRAAGYDAAREAAILRPRQASLVTAQPVDRSAPPVPRLMTIPSDDMAFTQHCQRLLMRHRYREPGQLQARLRRLFPCVVVRERVLSGEPTAWYVYRDGGWRGSSTRPWWLDRRISWLLLSPDGWLQQANPAARSLLGLTEDDHAHYTDWVTPGTLEDAQTLFAVVAEGHPLEGTLLVRPNDGETIACQVRGELHDDGVAVWLRLAHDVPIPIALAAPQPTVRGIPQDDPLFSAAIVRSMSRMPDPSPDGLALRLRHLYPHAWVRVTPEGWVASRDRPGRRAMRGQWWTDPSNAVIRYDESALITWANDAAVALLGVPLVGCHWQELVTPTTEDEILPLLAVIRDAGAAVSRFRMPRGDGSLFEFDSYTRVDGEGFTTILRPVAAAAKARRRRAPD